MTSPALGLVGYARAAFTAEERAEIASLLPPDIRLVVSSPTSRGSFTLRAWRGDELVSTYERMRDPVAAARLMAGVLSAEALTVTTDTLGYITSIETTQ